MAHEEASRTGRRRTHVVGSAARRASAATGRAAGYTYRQARRATRAEGAGDTGLYRLIELHAFNAAGDAAVAISLAGTLFFQVPTGEARLQVAQFLLMTMLPFAIVAPLIGPALDRFGHGRRWAIGSTMALRGFLCWVLADAARDFFPRLSVDRATVERAHRLAGEESLDLSLRRALVDSTDELERALRVREEFWV